MTCGCNAIYGYVSTLDEDIRQWFISKYIIGEAEHLLSHRRRNRNLLAQADDIVNKTDGRRLTMEMEQTADGLHSISDFQLLTLERRKSVIQEVMRSLDVRPRQLSRVTGMNYETIRNIAKKLP